MFRRFESADEYSDPSAPKCPTNTGFPILRAQPRPQPAPDEGKTVKSWDRPAHEVLRHEEMRTAFREFAREIRKLGKPVFIGEFGALGFENKTAERFEEVLARFERAEAALAALWVFGYDKRLGYYTLQV